MMIGWFFSIIVVFGDFYFSTTLNISSYYFLISFDFSSSFEERIENLFIFPDNFSYFLTIKIVNIL
jgi:hypothetical protein